MLMNICLAGMAGMIGCLIGGTPAFIVMGFAGILSTVMNCCGVDTAWFNDTIVNFMLLPAIIFDGDVLAVAYAARKYDINGYDTWRSLAFSNDPFVLLVGAAGGILGYLIFSFVSYIGLPLDCGAFTVMSVAILVRLTLSKGRKMREDGFEILTKIPKKVWVFHAIFAGILAFVFGYFCEETGFYTIGFYISAVSLIFLVVDPVMPATHHITLVAGYAMMTTHQLWVAVLLGILSELLCYAFTIVFNDKCSTHVDPPTVPILLFSFILFAFFQ